MASARQLLHQASTPEDLTSKLLEAADMLEDNLEASPSTRRPTSPWPAVCGRLLGPSACCSTSPTSAGPRVGRVRPPSTGTR